MRAFIKELRLQDVAGRANVRNRVCSRGYCAVTAVTRGTGGSRQVATNNHRLVMNAVVVVFDLSRGQMIRLHQGRVGVASRAGRCDIKRMHGRAWVRAGKNIVRAMAVRTNGNLGITMGELNAVDAGSVLRELVGSQCGIELLHAIGVCVTGAAEFRNVLALDAPAKS